MGIFNAPLLHALSAAAIPRLADFQPQELANFAWSFATLGMVDAPLRNSIS